MTAQQTRTGGKFLSLDRSHSIERANTEEAREAGQPATAPLWEFLSKRSLGALLAWMRTAGTA